MMFSEVSEHFTDVVMMEIGIIGVDEDVIQVNEDANIKEVTKTVVHELLKVAGELVSPKGITHHSKEL